MFVFVYILLCDDLFFDVYRMNTTNICRDEGLWLLNIQDAMIKQSKDVLIVQQTQEDLIDCLQDQPTTVNADVQVDYVDGSDRYASL